MVAPAFEFTDRAIPIVQTGRGARPSGELWGTATWGESLWGGGGWEPAIWTDLTCEVHEITTDTGRGGATDRFVPGTAYIVASNVHQVSEMLFPAVPAPAWESEFVPQPPIDHEEELQAPDAATVTSNGWSFSDDFETRPPRWTLPAAWADGLVGPFKLIDEAWEPEVYQGAGPDFHYQGFGAAQWTRSYDPVGISELEVELSNFDWPAATIGGPDPELRVDLLLRMNTTTKECYAARFRFVPIFGGPNEMYVELWHMAADGSKVDGTTMTTPDTAGTGSNGIFGARTLRAQIAVTVSGGFPVMTASVSDGGPTAAYTDPTPWTGGDRVGIVMEWEQAEMTSVTRPDFPPHITQITGPDFVDDMTRPLGSGWTLPARWAKHRDVEMIQDGGAMIPGHQRFQDRYGGEYVAEGQIQWVSAFDGDQFLEVQVTNMSTPAPIDSPTTRSSFELYTHANPNTLACMVADIEYWPFWDTDDDMIRYRLYQRGPNWSEIDYAPTAEGEIHLAGTDGTFPEPARWRIESDLDGEQRLSYNGTVLLTAQAPEPATGDRIGLHADWAAAPPGLDDDYSGRRVGVLRFEQVSAGLQEPLGTEELGTWIRIGVDHATLGDNWFFRGFVDGIVPTYVPDRPDAVRIECIDSLGEAGRVFVDGDRMPHPFAMAPDRIRQTLRRAHWPHRFWKIFDDATVMSRPAAGKAVDALTHIAESCGGAVYGDPTTGDIVFKGQDWQGSAAAGEASAWITNWHPDVDIDGLPRICPTGWERSSRRADMNTRVRFTSEASTFGDGEPIIKEWRAPQAEALYGVELYERTLLAATGERLNQLARRQLRLRHPNQFPRIEAVLLDAATATEALDLMTTATWTRPDKFGCQLRRGDGFVFNRRMVVTGVRHQMSPTRWTCRLALDPASVFAESGGRWGEARWSRGEWGRTR